MKKKTSLAVAEFRQLIDAMLAKAEEETQSTKARLDAMKPDVPG